MDGIDSRDKRLAAGWREKVGADCLVNSSQIVCQFKCICLSSSCGKEGKTQAQGGEAFILSQQQQRSLLFLF